MVKAAQLTVRKPVVASESVRRSFGAIVRDLLIERGFTTGIGNPNWSGFAQQLGDVSYESLRKAVTQERDPGVKIMEEVARGLGVSPDIFWEYRLAQAQRAFDPREVGMEAAYRNLLLWLEATGG
jgi:hypothetical protein